MFRLLLVVLAVEIAAHAFRIVDVPRYEVNERIGYIPKPNQSGRFLWTNRWVTNELSMGTGRPFAPSSRFDVLLIGDSIVNGGNQLDQSERLGPLLEHQTGWAVWPVSAGSWGLHNQLTYLEDHPEVVAGIERIVFVLNDGDFGPKSTQTIQPQSYPLPALLYLFKRLTPPKSPVVQMTRDPISRLARFSDKATVILFAKRDQDDCSWAPPRLAEAQCIVLPDHLYRDATHPSAEGAKALALRIKVP